MRVVHVILVAAASTALLACTCIVTVHAQPTPVATIANGGAHTMDIHDISNRTYAVVTGYEGVQIIDITDPAKPMPAAWLSGSYSAAIHDVSGKAHLLVSSRYGSVCIIDI